MIRRCDFATSEQLAAALAEDVANGLRHAIGQRGGASLAVSGGTTPKLFFGALCEQQLPWQRVSVTLVDERWVPEGDDRSNANLVKSHLLRRQAAKARFVPLYTAAATPEEGLDTAEAALNSMQLPLDIVILGMGTDGHTASFFPGGDNLQAALDEDTDRLLIAMRAPGAGEPRVTLTRNVLLRSHTLYLHIEGAEKAAVLDQALKPGPIDEMPVRAMLHQDQADLAIFHAP